MSEWDKEFLEHLEKGGKPREIDFIPDEILEQEIKLESEPHEKNIKYHQQNYQ